MLVPRRPGIHEGLLRDGVNDSMTGAGGFWTFHTGGWVWGMVGIIGKSINLVEKVISCLSLEG